ncbi:MAG TPA: TOBE domain-containing protein [Syntrophothermus lipocalidus]|nr:TOBE domain-containing protein [Syntrophothermus sp.]HOV42767.1 TOBE domain-containing protein [Syntrophothermus lipocalidus]
MPGVPRLKKKYILEHLQKIIGEDMLPADMMLGKLTKEEILVRISAPNKLVGKVASIKESSGMTEVVIDIGDQPVTAVITAGAADALSLRPGDEVFAMFNATSVMLIKDTK